MFSTISWQSYWQGLAITTAVYYIVVYLVYFRRDVALFLSRKVRGDTIVTKDSPSDENNIDSDLPEEQDRAEAYMAYACIDEVKALFEQLKSSKGVKSEILYALQKLLAKYPALKTSAYQKSIATVIISQCEHICAIRLNKEEVGHAWMG
ncbi:MAG: hypothetical protein ACTHMD_19770 [Flavisolibacter sp.]